MGVDYTAHMMFGTTEEVKIPDFLYEPFGEAYPALSEDDLNSEYYPLTDEQKEIGRDFIGFRLYLNGYSSDFDGFGIEGKPGEVDEQKVRDLFAKYGFGEPDWVCFVNQH